MTKTLRFLIICASMGLLFVFIMHRIVFAEEKINGRYYAINMEKLGNPLINTKSVTVSTIMSKGLQTRVDIKTMQPRDNTHGFYICGNTIYVIQIACNEEEKKWFDENPCAEFIGNNVEVNTAEQRVRDWIAAAEAAYQKTVVIISTPTK